MIKRVITLLCAVLFVGVLVGQEVPRWKSGSTLITDLIRKSYRGNAELAVTPTTADFGAASVSNITVAGRFYVFDTANQHWVLADNRSSDTTEGLLGWALSVKPDEGLVTKGLITSSIFTNLPVGAAAYLGEDGGITAFSTNIPNPRLVGYVVAGGILELDPSYVGVVQSVVTEPYDPTATVDFGVSADTNGLTADKFYVFDADAGEWELADNRTNTTANGLIGWALDTDVSAGLITSGQIINPAFTNLPVGAAAYLGEDGGITAFSTNIVNLRQVGYIVGDGVLDLRPTSDLAVETTSN